MFSKRRVEVVSKLFTIRKQKVFINEALSFFKTVTAGEAQGLELRAQLLPNKKLTVKSP